MNMPPVFFINFLVNSYVIQYKLDIYYKALKTQISFIEVESTLLFII